MRSRNIPRGGKDPASVRHPRRGGISILLPPPPEHRNQRQKEQKTGNSGFSPKGAPAAGRGNGSEGLQADVGLFMARLSRQVGPGYPVGTDEALPRFRVRLVAVAGFPGFHRDGIGKPRRGNPHRHENTLLPTADIPA